MSTSCTLLLNNIFMVATGDWPAVFKASVFVLLALEIVGCSVGLLLLGRRTKFSEES